MNDAEWGNDPLPDVFINIRRTGKKIQCQTLDLKKLSQRQEDASNEVTTRSDVVVRELQTYIRGKVSDLFRISESVAILDMVTSFAQAAIHHRWVRPTFRGTLAVHAARHPILDCVSVPTSGVSVSHLTAQRVRTLGLRLWQMTTTPQTTFVSRSSQAAT
jgi:DNA mismatch repair protein MSH4